MTINLKTFRHLVGRRALPSNYVVTSTHLLYHKSIKPAVRTPTLTWIEKAQQKVSLIVAELDDFDDPLQKTYAAYVRRQKSRETVATGMLSALSDPSYAARLSPKWLAARGDFAATLRFPCHGLQMAIAYIGSMVLGSKVCIACGFQAADEARRIDHLAYLTRLAEMADEQVAVKARARWQNAAAWQPLRRLVENLLVTYAWDEALAALMLAVKPAFDALVFEVWAQAAVAANDLLFKSLLDVLAEDAAWHVQWSESLFRILVAQQVENSQLLSGWADAWTPKALIALTPLGAELDAFADEAARVAQAQLLSRAVENRRHVLLPM